MSGRPFLQLPGPTNLPDRILRAMDRPIVDHRGPEFAALTKSLLPGLRAAFGSREGTVVIYPGSGTGGWEAALVNVLAPGDRVLTFSHGQFGVAFAQGARKLGYEVDEVPLRWGQSIPAEEVEARLGADRGARPYRAVFVVHNETSTGVRADVGAIRAAMDAAGHDALLILDAVSSLASMPVRCDEWRVDVALTGSQKGLMLPPGLALLCVGQRALAISQEGGSPRNFFDWRPIIRENAVGLFPYTPATMLLFGLREALAMLAEEGWDAVFARHHRLASGVRAAIQAWREPQILCEDPACYSDTVTSVVLPDGLEEDNVRRVARERFGLVLGNGLGQLKGRVVRIGHLGALNELEVLATVAGVELTLRECGLDLDLGRGVAACQRVFAQGAAVAGAPK